MSSTASLARPILAYIVCFGLLVGTDAPRAAGQGQTPAGPVFVDGQAQVVQAFADSTEWIRERLWVETEFDSDRDGRRDRVHVDVTRQRQTGTEGLRVPVIYESSPYYARSAGGGGEFWNVEHELGVEPPPRPPARPITFRPDRTRISGSHVATWLPRGFAVVHSDAPGTGLSQGCPTLGGPPEALAPKAVIDWLNGRARGYTTPDGYEEVHATWSTGRVGMIGASYNGTIPLAAATTGVEGLEAIIPTAPNTSYWHYYRSNGLVRSPGGYLGEDIDFLYDFINSGNPATRPVCDAQYRDGEFARNLDRVTGDYNDFWRERDLIHKAGEIRAATFMAHAFNDWNVVPEHSVRIIEVLKETGVPLRIYFHQGGHGGYPPLEMQNRWFTRYLYGIENGVEDESRAWIAREGDSALNPTPYPDYPHPEAAVVALWPSGGGRGIGTLANAGADAPMTETLIDDVSFGGRTLARAEQSLHRLLYATPPLLEPVHISGTPEIRIRLASSRPAANLSVWLVALPPDPADTTITLITRGWADPQNHRSVTESEPLVPGEFYDVAFALQPDDQVVAAGARIALMIMSSDREFTLRPPPGTELSVDLSGTRVTIPVVGGEAAWNRAVGEGLAGIEPNGGWLSLGHGAWTPNDAPVAARKGFR